MKTKILITLGPASLNERIVTELSKLGIYLFRLNMSHTPLENVEKNIKKIQSWSDVPICLDSEGAQLRNQNMVVENLFYNIGDKVNIHYNRVPGTNEHISFTPPGMARHFEPGDRLKVDFNQAEFEILENFDQYCTAITINAGAVSSNKAADINRDLPFASLTVKDVAAISIGLDNGIENFALSFANNRAAVQEMKRFCRPSDNIICKIESRQGVENLGDIIGEADEILIDRGDLSRQIPLHKISVLQRQIIAAANKAGKNVHVATNLLETMTDHPSPSRAEINDVVSTILMGADGLVLAAETAIGKHPLEAVKMMRLLIKEAESFSNY
tara:strand:- start:13405 stop:14391 length:987 start_codon:yes stop_codon:yes gene_type:complete